MTIKNAEISISTFFSKLIEHRFIADIMMIAWYKHQATVEILRSEIDVSGYDIIMSYKNIKRHIQLKSSIAGGRTVQQRINISLLEKENPCIVWLVREYDEEKKDFNFKYLFWGARTGGRNTADIKNCKKPRDAKGKKEKLNHRNVPKGKFEVCEDIEDLFSKLFGNDKQ